MKKLLRFADCFVLLAAILGCILRLWLQNSGLDSKGLYQADHPAWLLLCLLSVVTVVFMWFLSRTAGNNQSYAANFRPGIVSTVTYLALAVLLAHTGITGFLDSAKFLDKLTAVAAMLAAVMLAVTGIERFSGNRPAPFLHLIPCAYYALRMFCMGRDLGTEPEICSFLFGFFGAVCMVPAFYHLWAFDMNAGNRRYSLFFSLTAAYFCLVSTFENTQGWIQNMVTAAFLLSNLCQLKPLFVKKAPVAEEAAPIVEAAAPIVEEAEPAVEEPPVAQPIPIIMPGLEALDPETEQEPQFATLHTLPPLFPAKSQPVLHADIDPDADLDAFLADIKKFLDNE